MEKEKNGRDLLAPLLVYWILSLCRDRPKRLRYSLLNSTTYRNDNENNSNSLKLLKRFAVGG